MSKSGAGSNRLFVDQYDISGNVGAVTSLNASRALMDATDITQKGMDRRGLLADGKIAFAGLWDGDTVHDILSPIRQNCLVSFFSAVNVGAPVAGLAADQTTYQAVRGADGSMAFDVEADASAGAGLEWGYGLTTGAQLFATAGYGSDADDLAGSPTSTAFGAILYVHLFSLDSGNITINAVEGAAATPTTAIAGCTTALLTTPGAYRLPSTSATALIHRYTRIHLTGTFVNATIAAALIRPIGPQA